MSQWAVTDFGIECEAEGYYIPRDRVWEPDWRWHLAGKQWVNLPEFEAAWHDAKLRWPVVGPRRRITTGERMRILARDAFRCQLCGRTAADGVVLHVDHKHPFSRGGSNADDNLWTLCRDCNLGKRAHTLDELKAN